MALAEFESATNMKAATTMTPEMLLKQQEEQSSTLIQMELQRIEKMKKRQQKELESMIQVYLNSFIRICCLLLCIICFIFSTDIV